MYEATLTSKGQVTIPNAVRERLNLTAGDKIEFLVQPDNQVVIRPVGKSVDDVFGMLKDAAQTSATTEQMDEAVKTHLEQKHANR